ncbi:MAG: hypothetical protein H5T33_00710 [Candidatus Methanosuratus sp.]|nr:hypothetical protein [Candidatus Methanosuratincola sp.]
MEDYNTGKEEEAAARRSCKKNGLEFCRGDCQSAIRKEIGPAAYRMKV